jgi:hypothetical protein
VRERPDTPPSEVSEKGPGEGSPRAPGEGGARGDMPPWPDTAGGDEACRAGGVLAGAAE